jgi:hypothetical protein
MGKPNSFEIFISGSRFDSEMHNFQVTRKGCCLSAGRFRQGGQKLVL